MADSQIQVASSVISVGLRVSVVLAAIVSPPALPASEMIKPVSAYTTSQNSDGVTQADLDQAIAYYRTAVDLYAGDYLPDALYEDWVSAERERLLTLYLSGASRLAELLLQRREEQEVITLAESILARDRCWEEAYRILMLAYDRRGNRPQAVRAYHRCTSALREELDLDPMPETTRFYLRIRGEN